MRFLERWAAVVVPGLLILGTTGRAAAFTDVAAPPINATGGSDVSAQWIDYDGDGDLDLSVVNFGAPGAKLFRNNGAAFVDVTPATFPPSEGGAAVWADYDADGDLDVFFNVGTGNNRLLRNDSGAYVDRTPAAVLDTGGEGDACWLDFDGDGDLDLWVTSFDSAARLARNDNGTFVNATPPVLSSFADWGSEWGDYDNDGDWDLLAMDPSAPSILARNDGGGTFVNATPPALAAAVAEGGGDWGDFDDDGDLDVAFASWASNPAELFRNDRAAGFAEIESTVVSVSGFGLSAVWQDYDFDTDLDLLMGGGPTTLARNDGGGSFARADSALFAVGGDGGSFAWGDYDGDGDVDLFAAGIFSGVARLLRNDDTGSNQWLHIELIGTKLGIVPYGARITLTAGGKTQMRDLACSNGLGNQNSFAFEFGLGAATSASTVTIRWPSGETQILRDVPAGEKLRVTEPTFLPALRSFTPGSAISLSFSIESTRVTSGTLMHRAAGSGDAFSGVALSIAGDQAFATVPASSLTENGLEYFIDFRLSGGSRSVFEPGDGAARPAFLPASLNRSLTNAPASKQYVLFGVPFDPSNASAGAVLEDELGAPNKNNWRFGRFNPGTGGYDEHPSPSLSLNGGQGFWLIMKDAIAVGTAGTSRNPVGGFRVTLSPGANMIAHPFLFPVTLADVDFSAAPSVETRLVSFLAGSGYVDSNQLAPWRGYWMFNNGGSAETIVIPGVRSAGARLAPPSVEPDGWWIAATARQGSSVDASNVAGMTRTSALPTATEPPGLPGYVRAYYEDGASGGRRALTRDIRENDRRGASWNLVVDGPTDEPIHLSFDGLSSVPSDFEAILIPELTLASIDLRAQDALVLVGGVHRFELVVGTSEFVQAVRTGAERTPAQFVLGLGYPNPLHGSTSVGFALPTEAFVDMGVYDVQGRLVRTLVSETRSAGRYVAPWNARDNDERAVAPGVYFVRLRAGTFDASHKLVVVR